MERRGDGYIYFDDGEQARHSVPQRLHWTQVVGISQLFMRQGIAMQKQVTRREGPLGFSQEAASHYAFGQRMAELVVSDEVEVDLRRLTEES